MREIGLVNIIDYMQDNMHYLDITSGMEANDQLRGILEGFIITLYKDLSNKLQILEEGKSLILRGDIYDEHLHNISDFMLKLQDNLLQQKMKSLNLVIKFFTQQDIIVRNMSDIPILKVKLLELEDLLRNLRV